MKMIVLEKIDVVANGLPAANRELHVAGQDQGDKFSLPTGYQIEGILITDRKPNIINPKIEVGEPVFVFRTKRNGIESTGLFHTSEVTEVSETEFKTKNSVYQYRFIEHDQDSFYK